MRKRNEVGTFGPASDVRHIVKAGERVDEVIPVERATDEERSKGFANPFASRVRRKHHGPGSGRAKALDLIRQRGALGATAMEIGIAMVQGTLRSHYMSDWETEQMGLRTGAALVRTGEAMVTKGNRFVLKP